MSKCHSGAPVIALRYISFDVPVKYKVVILYRIWVVTRVFRPIIFVDKQRLWDIFIVVCRKNNGEWSMTNKLNNILSELKEFQWVDLTHTFGPDSPHFPAFAAAKFETLFTHDDGFFRETVYLPRSIWYAY